MEKNVIVIDEIGSEIGRTYPKRAKGLVKNGRAVQVDDQTIRLLNNCPTDIYLQEDVITMNTLLFNAKEWKKNTEAAGTSERSFMTVFDELKEVYSLASADQEVAEISNIMAVEPNTEYSLAFWANINEEWNAIAQLQIVYSEGDFTAEELEDKAIYKLNGDYIKPVKTYKGWKLFVIPFTTDDRGYASLKFVAANTELLIMKAEIEPKKETEDVDVVAKLGEYANKGIDSAKKLGGKAVELGKKYKEPAKELGEKSLNTIKKGTDKLFTSEPFKKIEEMLTGIVSSKKNEEPTETPVEAGNEIEEVEVELEGDVCAVIEEDNDVTEKTEEKPEEEKPEEDTKTEE